MNSRNSKTLNNAKNAKYFLITVDVEDWFQVENFKPYVPFSSWQERELRVEKNTHRLLNLLDSLESTGKPEAGSQRHSNAECGMRNAESKCTGKQQKSETSSHLPATGDQGSSLNYELNGNGKPTTKQEFGKKVRCTFFVLGWIAERLPNLVLEIQSRGHEIASHGENHQLPYQLSVAELKQDLLDSKKRLEDIAGSAVCGYRAPSFAINNDIIKIIEDSGYHYDSSYNSFNLHGRYGRISLNGSGKMGIAHKILGDFFELPISNLVCRNIFNFRFSALNSRLNATRKKNSKRFVLPFGGGGYFRLMPLSLFKMGINKILEKDNAYLFYMHPWEIDPEQPKVSEASAGYKFRHYVNLRRTSSRLVNLIKSFSHCRFASCSQYLSDLV